MIVYAFSIRWIMAKSHVISEWKFDGFNFPTIEDVQNFILKLTGAKLGGF